MNAYLRWGLALALALAGFAGGCSMKQAQLDRMQAEYTQKVNDALEANRQLERRMQADADAIALKYRKEQENAQKTIDSLRSRIASGDIRLSVPVSTARMPGGSSPEPGETRAELDGETAQSLVSIAADGDRAIRDLNQCIDRYNAVRGSR